ncbi:MAG: ABC transporter permease, partial [Chitinophagaceae bacterium]
MLSFILSTLRVTLEEFGNNRIRTFLSMLGIAIGIFCIISIQATTESLERNIKKSMTQLGVNTLFIQKMPWGGGNPSEFWKYRNRPNVKLEEAELIKKRSVYSKAVSFTCFTESSIEFKNTTLENVIWYGISEDFNKIQDVEVQYGRYISSQEFQNGNSVVLLGHDNAEKLFFKPEDAIGKTIQIGNYRSLVIGVIKKTGKSLIGGWDFDNIILVSTSFCKRLSNYRNLNGFIMVKGVSTIPTDEVQNEIRGIMRASRRLSPKQEENFSLNDVTAGSAMITSFFGKVNLGGWFIAFLSLLVGGFGIANIMFVSVRERTPIIGLKKAIGAKRSIILSEFLLESAFLCIIGGILGLALVFPLTFILSKTMNFSVTLSLSNIILSFIICFALGMISGIIPASIAAKMNPVDA